MSRERKFERGRPFESLDQLAQWCMQDGRYVFWHNFARPWHGRAFVNMQFSEIAKAVAQGTVCRATVRPEWIEAQTRREQKAKAS